MWTTAEFESSGHYRYINHANLQEMLWNATVSDTDHCAEGSDFSALILHATPYLYPFSIIDWHLVHHVAKRWYKVDNRPDGKDGSSTRSSRNNYDSLLLRNHPGLYLVICLIIGTHTDRSRVRVSILPVLVVLGASLTCCQLIVLDVNANPDSQLNDLRHFICILSFFTAFSASFLPWPTPIT
ncbi:hypothetical protein OUZ56_007476 [Daphnia magna]|uniref:Uncharacterized protein n=1 Tax=Daphnia magna TaxID=35525 RepID=A0ABR0AA94_9CRUS|nr:hypothetical protein OUZ56_007476 [Daphnia magna]